MILKGSLTVVAIIFFLSSQSQNITVLDQQSRAPISDVYIYHADKKMAASTDSRGKVNLLGFPMEGKIVFQHPAYITKSIDLSIIRNGGKEVFLEVKVITFDEIVIAANKWEQNKEEIPNAIASITSEKIVFQNPQTSADLLANTGQVFVQKSQLGGGSPKLRGFSANAVLLVLDGIRMNNAIYRSGNLQNVINIDPHVIDRAEVLFGPGSVMYGSDALGGVMDFHTRNPKWKSIEANAVSRVSSATNERMGHLDVSLANERIGWLGSISFSKFGDMQAGSNRSDDYKGYFERNWLVKRKNGQDVLVRNRNPELQTPSGFNTWTSLNKVRWKLSNYTLITYTHYYSTTSDIPRYDRLTIPVENSDSLVYAEWNYGPQTWQMHSVKLDLFKKTPYYDQFRLTTSFQNYEESRQDRRFGSPLFRTRSEKVDIYTLNLDFDLELRNSKLFYGVDFFINDVQSTANTKNIVTGTTSRAGTRYPDGGSFYSSGAAYANYQWFATNNIIVNGGLRYSQIDLSASTNDPVAQNYFFDEINLTNRALNGSIGAVYNQDKIKLSLLASTGFRAPNVDDVGKLFEVDENTIVVPNDDLKPEYSYNQEIGLTYLFSSSLKAEMVVYHSLLTNAIVRGPYDIEENPYDTLQVRAQVNANKARIFGGSISLNYKPMASFDISSVLNLNEGKDLTNNQPLRHSTPVFGQTIINYKYKGLRSSVEAIYHFDRKADDIPDTEIIDKAYLYTPQGSPGWFVINSRFSYEIQDIVTFDAGIENIFDIHYRPYTSGISAPGRNFYIGIRAGLSRSRS